MRDVDIHFFCVNLGKLSRNLGNFSSKMLFLDTFYIKFCSVLALYHTFDLYSEFFFDVNIKNCITKSHFYAISIDQTSEITFFGKNTLIDLV